MTRTCNLVDATLSTLKQGLAPGKKNRPNDNDLARTSFRLAQPMDTPMYALAYLHKAYVNLSKVLSRHNKEVPYAFAPGMKIRHNTNRTGLE